MFIKKIGLKSKKVITLSLMMTAFLLIGSEQSIAKDKKENNLTQQRSTKVETNLSDYQAIRDNLNLYIEGGRQGKSSIMKSAFHPQAVMYGHVDGKLVGGPIQILFDGIDNAPPAKNLKADVTKIDIAGKIAQAQVESRDWSGASYTDMFQFVKDGTEWKILVKEYHTH